MQTGARSSPIRGDGEVQEIARRANLVGHNVGSVILGKEDVIASCVVALLAGGHVSARYRHRLSLARLRARGRPSDGRAVYVGIA